MLIGSVLDLIIGDPHGIPHPIVWIGKWIGFLDRKLGPKEGEPRVPDYERRQGVKLVAATVLPTAALSAAALGAAYAVHPVAGVAVESTLTCYCLAARSLQKESSHVIEELEENGLDAGRKALSMIVGRDTAELPEEEVVKAAVETVAENTADGVVAPLMYLAAGGPVLGLTYKAINTMDSMVGYKNDRYRDLGTAAARLDDAAGFVPARLTGLFLAASAGIFERLGDRTFNGRDALRIFRRDRLNHKSPNSAHSEAAAAGALGLKLGGGAYYFGKWVEKPSMGDEKRPVEHEDVKRTQKLMYGAAGLTLAGALAGLGLFAMMRNRD